jgi:GTPase SAR1 family protein
MNKYYYQSRIGVLVSYERENLIRSNYSFSDVYFSFTESIAANPPYYLAVSKKLIYKIDSIPEIFEKFPNLKPDARILLMVNKGDFDKSRQTIENEQNAIKTARILFSSEHYDVYEIDRGFRAGNAKDSITP